MRGNRVDVFKSVIQKMIAKNDAAYEKLKGRESTKKHLSHEYSPEDIERIVKEGTSIEKCKLSQHFFEISGLYKRIILHYSTFLTYSWLLIPHAKGFKGKLSEKSNQKQYYEAAEFCSDFDIEDKCTMFATRVLVDGGYYGIIHDNAEGIAIQTLPFAYCRSRFKNRQDVDVIEFDLRFFDKEISDDKLRREILKAYPSEIQKGYKKYKREGQGADPWMFISEKIGIYFCYIKETPFFLDLIPLIDDLEDYKDINKQRNLLALKRIVTQEIPHDGLNLLFEPDEALEIHDGVVEMLSDSPDTDVITSYGKVGLLDLSGEQADRTDVERAQQLVYDAAGVTKELFSATTQFGMEVSLDNDLSMMMILGRKFAHFFSVLMNNKFGNKKISFNFVILPVSYYNLDEYTSRAKDLAAFGYVFLTPVAASGVNQVNLSDLKSLENDVLDLDEVLKPLQSAYTQSGKTNAVTAQATKDANKTATASSSSSSSSESKSTTSTSSGTSKSD